MNTPPVNNNNHNNTPNQPGVISIAITDLVKIVGFIMTVIGVVITVNNQITTLEIKQKQLEEQYQEVKKLTTAISVEITEQKDNERKDRERLRGQLQDLENSISQIYQRVTATKK